MKRKSLAIALIILIIAAGVGWYFRPLDWSLDERLTFAAGDSRIVRIAHSGSNVHVAWQDDRDGKREIYYKRSADRGITWGRDTRLTSLNVSTSDPFPSIASTGKIVFVVFPNRTRSGEDLFYVASQDGGLSFAAPRQLTMVPDDQTNPAVALDGRIVHVVWHDYRSRQYEIYYRRSDDDGFSWEPEVRLTEYAGQDLYPAIFATSNQVFVTWTRTKSDGGGDAVFLRASHDGGNRWEPEFQLSAFKPTGWPPFSSVSSNGTGVHVVWNMDDVIYARSFDMGRSWKAGVAITSQKMSTLSPVVSANEESVHVVWPAIWTENRTTTADLYYMRSDDGGDSWDTPLRLSTHLQGLLSLAPSITASSGEIFVAWQDNRDGNYEVYFSSKPDFATLTGYVLMLIASTVFIIALAVLLSSEITGTTRKEIQPVELGKVAREPCAPH